jgi:hypothetical protein
MIVWATFAIIQWGSVITTMNTITDLGRATARFAAVHATESTFLSASSTPAAGSVQAFFQQQCGSSTVNYADFADSKGTVGKGPGVGTLASDGSFTPTTTFTAGSPVAIYLGYPMWKKVYASKLVPGLSQWATVGYYVPKVTVMVVEKPSN